MTSAIRVDLQLIADMVNPATRALDVGCGDGALLAYLVNFKRVDARGMELSQAGVNACVANGLSVIQGDADADLRDYPDDAFDYVILSQTLQATREPREVLRQMLRVGKRAIVSFPNFAHWQVRLRLVFGGRMPETPSLPFKWYDTPNIHLCSIDDFRALCARHGRAHRTRHRARPRQQAGQPAASARQSPGRAGGVHAAGGTRDHPFVLGLDVVFAELHEAVSFVEAARRTAAQHLQPHREAERIGLRQQHFQDRSAQPAIVMLAGEVERIDLDLALADAEGDTARRLVTDQDQPEARLTEMLAEDPPRPRGLVTEHALQVLAHHIDANRQQRLEIGLAHRAETPDVDHASVSRAS